MTPVIFVLASLLTAAPPTYEAEVEVRLRVIDVRVTDKKGRFVPGLERDAFRVHEDQQLRPIETFDEIRYTGFGEGPGPGLTSTGFTSPPRRFVFVLDRTRPGRAVVFKNVRKRLADFVEKSLSPGDMVSVAQYSQQKDVLKDFRADPESIINNIYGGDVNDKGKLRTYVLEVPTDRWDRIESPYMAAVSAAMGRGVQVGLGEKLDRFFQFSELERFFRFLEAIGRGLEMVPSPKAVVLATGGFDVGQVLAEGTELQRRGVQAFTAIANSGAQLYIINPLGLRDLGVNANISGADADRWGKTSPPTYTRKQQDSLLWMVEQAGGQVFRNSNNYSGAFKRISSQESGYYSLGFKSSVERDGKPHSVKVEVEGKGLKVHAPKAFLAPAEPKDMLETVRRVGLIGIATKRQAADGVEVELAAAALRDPEGTQFVRVAIHLGSSDDERDVHLQSESWRGPFRSADMRVGPEARAIGVDLEAVPGPVNLALAVQDRGDHAIGTAFLDLQVPDFETPPGASLWSPGRGEQSELPVPAVVEADECLPVRVDVYGTMPSEPPSSTAQPLPIAWSVEGLELELAEQTWSRANGSDRLLACVDVNALPAGDHLLRARIGDDDDDDDDDNQQAALTLPFVKQSAAVP